MTLMQIAEQQILIDEVKNAMLKLYGERLSGLILYGSYARQDFDEASDIDFLVLLNREELDYGKEIQRIVKVIYPLMLDHDIIISCLPSTLTRWNTEHSFFFERIKKDGVPIWMKKSYES
jgi:predicted nucleotidyltransferase